MLNVKEKNNLAINIKYDNFASIENGFINYITRVIFSGMTIAYRRIRFIFSRDSRFKMFLS